MSRRAASFVAATYLAIMVTACSSQGGGAADAGSGPPLSGAPVKIVAIDDASDTLPFKDVDAAVSAITKVVNSTGGIKGRPLDYTICSTKGGDQNNGGKCAREAVADNASPSTAMPHVTAARKTLAHRERLGLTERFIFALLFLKRFRRLPLRGASVHSAADFSAEALPQSVSLKIAQPHYLVLKRLVVSRKIRKDSPAGVRQGGRVTGEEAFADGVGIDVAGFIVPPLTLSPWSTPAHPSCERGRCASY